MARLVDCYPSNEDEIPSLDFRPQTPMSKQNMKLADSATTPVTKRDLVPKSTIKPSTRKVRRLGGGLSENPLFQPWKTMNNCKAGSASMIIEGSPRRFSRVNDNQATYLRDRASQQSPETPEPRIPSLFTVSPRTGHNFSLRTRLHVMDDSLSVASSSEQLSNRLKRSFAGGTDMTSLTTNHESGQVIHDGDEQSDRSTSDPLCYLPDLSSNLSTDNRRVVARDSSHIVLTSECETESSHFSELSQLSSNQSAHNAPQNLYETTSRNQSALLPSTLSPLQTVTKLRVSNALNLPRSPDLSVTYKTTYPDVRNSPKGKENLEASYISTVVGDDKSAAAIADQLENDCRFQTTTVSTHKSERTSQPPKRSIVMPETHRKLKTDSVCLGTITSNWSEPHISQKPTLHRSRAKSTDTGLCSASRVGASFNASKHTIAEAFFRELDETITSGRLAAFTQSTGGVKLVWSKTLNTTAGRANWKREAIMPAPSDVPQSGARYNHHASIELAEKVINEEQRLLNVIAHEFCHLANFMINGITNNPHGKEFKVWAAKCSSVFADRGIEVTTRHSYEIDYKYTWQCTECATEYRRHSRSINIEKQRCGGCRGRLVQVKPKPRANAKASEYQMFVKEQMKMLKTDNSNGQVKDNMKLVAQKWANRQTAGELNTEKSVDHVVQHFADLALEDSL